MRRPAAALKGRARHARDGVRRSPPDESLRPAEARFRTLVEQLPLVVYVHALDPESSNLYSSPQIEPLLGYSTEEWRTNSTLFVELLHPEDRERVLAARARARATGESLRLEYRLIARDGRVVWVSDEARIVKDEDGNAPFLQGCLLDITARKEAEDQLRHQAFHDPLTGLANRALFTDRVEHALLLRRVVGREVAVLFLDIDDFKTVNDSLGHLAGDELLRAVGGRLHSAVRAGDTVARFGGDEFAVLLEGVRGPAEAAQTAERIGQALMASFPVAGQEVFAGASIGIAIGRDAAELLRTADLAMYRAKANGKGGYAFYEPAMDEVVLERLQLVADLRRANVEDEFVLRYQPTIELATGRILGMEAIPRWEHPQRGLLAPADFIGLAEETGLTVPIGAWILAEACRQAALWNAEFPSDPPLTMSVNVSARQLQHSGLRADVEHAVRQSGLEPQALMLEVTESDLVQSGDQGIRALEALSELGVRLALDDFGTGYASFWALRNLPVETVKIDRSFIQDVDAGAEQSAMARGIVELGRALGLGLVAEGIERGSQSDELLRLGCSAGQGLYFARPLAGDAISKLLAGSAGPS